MKPEKDVINEILLRASERGHRLFRQNVGKAWVGKLVRRSGPVDTTVTLSQARPLIAGLCVGSSDVIGYTATGQFVALEVKTPGVRVTPEQKAFLDAARSRGCITGIVFSADEALELLP